MALSLEKNQHFWRMALVHVTDLFTSLLASSNQLIISGIGAVAW